MNEIDKWSAEQCGVEIRQGFLNSLDGFFLNGGEYHYLWTLEDPRCMQIFREKFEIDTCCDNTSFGKWSSVSYRPGDEHILEGFGKTIPEAEMAVAQAIYEAIRGSDE